MNTQRIKIFGAPGTGKTTRALELLRAHLAAGDHVLFVSFTKAAQVEAEARLVKEFSIVPADADVRTLHSLAMRGLKVPQACLMNKFTVSTFAQTLRAADQDTTGIFRRGLAYSDRLRNMAGRNEPVLLDPLVDEASLDRIARSYAQFKNREGYNDFTDLIERVVQGQGTFDEYEVVIVDEAQDLTTLQWRFVDRLASAAHTLYMIGDDDQAIYRFLGADVDYFLHSPADRVEVLDYSYRLSHDVQAYATHMIGKVRDRQPKVVASNGTRSGMWLGVTNMEGLPFGKAPGRELVLARNRRMLKPLVREVGNRCIPFTGPGSPFSEPSRGFLELVDMLQRWAQGPITAQEYKKHRKFVRPDYREILDTRHAQFLQPHARKQILPQLNYVHVGTPGWWWSFLNFEKTEEHQRLRTILQRTLEKYTMAECLHPRIDMLTIHGAKGLEADCVYLVPDLTQEQRAQMVYHDDEHRLFYVAMTRTKGPVYAMAPTNEVYYPLDRP